MRASLRPEPVESLMGHLFALVGLGLAGLIVGSWLLDRMVNHLRQEGRLGL